MKETHKHLVNNPLMGKTTETQTGHLAPKMADPRLPDRTQHGQSTGELLTAPPNPGAAVRTADRVLQTLTQHWIYPIGHLIFS